MYITRKPSPSRHRRGAGAHACDHGFRSSLESADLPPPALKHQPHYLQTLPNADSQGQAVAPCHTSCCTGCSSCLGGSDAGYCEHPITDNYTSSFLLYATLYTQAGPGSDAMPYHSFCGCLGGQDAGYLLHSVINHTSLLRPPYLMPPCVYRRDRAATLCPTTASAGVWEDQTLAIWCTQLEITPRSSPLPILCYTGGTGQ